MFDQTLAFVGKASGYRTVDNHSILCNTSPTPLHILLFPCIAAGLLRKCVSLICQASSHANEESRTPGL